jgi:endonuclease/exonuclease/phosphatase family metal-dependent hydrolase
MARAEVQLPDNRRVRVVDVHPYTPKRQLIDRWREGLESLPSTGAGTPWLLVGDFNATLDHAELRDVIDRGYRDAADTTGQGLTPTWPKGRVLPPPVTIDHILADKRFLIGDYGVDPLPGSDHHAIFARLALTPEP